MWFKKKKDTSVSIPDHIAIIMDGNGRWAVKRNLPRLAGHRAGVEALKRTVREANALGVKYLTVYAFSTENWNRPEDEVSGLMELIVFFLKRDLKELSAEGVRIRTIGNLSDLPAEPLKEIESAIDATKNNTKLQLVIALNYGGRQEIVQAVKRIAEQYHQGLLALDAVNEDIISKNLYTWDIPDPDLVIRTSGEVRISNFMLWQSSYSEYFFSDILWPEFNRSNLEEAIRVYSMRDRRFGKVKKG